ncbi:phosphate ABC transporter permease PstA [Amaricoccus solimangrovi]|uniref:Phosphate transport system permease protein PstA n=1 Tax=Amaricoccus solimangrovi TaxID=2589815 RepID=A0A501WUX7_9RHOB|nr:phosphate ABC transporter permease PstA [Amaricoccus solimangrovi]TPE53553.1 phosphate ABC transporter permease PstA [Amaricoccus solimangrovi]
MNAPAPHRGGAAEARRRRRHRADRLLRLLGLGAISLALGLLGVLIATLVIGATPALTQTKLRVTFAISPELIDPADPGIGAYRLILRRGVAALLPEQPTTMAEWREIGGIVTGNTQFAIRDAVMADPSLIGRNLTLTVPVSDAYDQLGKGLTSRDTPPERRKLSDREIARFDALTARGAVSRPFNWELITRSNSRFPETAGLAGAIVGSFYMLLVCFVVSFPAGIAAAVWLEEFAPRNRLTDAVEVNINNLAAVPSIVFGLLGLSVLIGVFGLPRSTPLVGGLVLSLMTLPTIIIVTRAALRAVPRSIREAAHGVGASRHQVVLHHVLPLAMPGILTGTIIGLAHALGETAPLLLIGMNAFITDPPGGILEASTALPTQIFIWAGSAEHGFVSRTCAAILVLLGFLLAMNAVAIYLRQRLERKT